MTPVLSILIPWTYDRFEVYRVLLFDLYEQIAKGKFHGQVEILDEVDDKQMSTGAKRNLLIERAKGRYVVFIDSDDHVSPNYVRSILDAVISDPDAVGLCGWMTTNGSLRVNWFISKDHDYIASKDENGNTIFLRWNNHLSPLKRSIAIKFKFPNLFVGEDYIWSKEIHDAGAVKTEVKIDEPLYHYDYRTQK